MGAKVGGWWIFFTEGNKGNGVGVVLLSHNDLPNTRHVILTFDFKTFVFRLRALAQKSALPPLVACRFFQQNLYWCFGELGAESLM
ncbi:MAG TPA: hypothetical protein DDW21_08610 [Verrucomicrobiales bacterium]|nr:MAG: hypothetical protein CAK88_12530 [Verrucomicrobiae bacterium AMD-G2]HBE23480.1 hypothetical protein [Verrucomicrobiales bacterium]